MKVAKRVVPDLMLSNKVVSILKQHIENHIKDKEFKMIFLNFIDEVYSKRIFTPNDRYAVNKYFEQWLITIFKDYTIGLTSWKQYCFSMKVIRIQNWSESGKRVARKILSKLYHFIIEKNINVVVKGLNELKENKEFLIWEERKITKIHHDLSEYQLDRFGTNFPLESSLDQIHFLPGDEKSSPIILNINNTNHEIKSLLLGYFYNDINNIHNNSVRQFIYLFRYSLLALQKEPQSIIDFTFEVYKKQYRFYRKTNFFNTSGNRSFSVQLTRFYVYLCRIIKENNIQHNIFEGTLYNERILGSNTFSPLYEKGYNLIAYNSFEDVPNDNRWLLIAPDGYANSRRHYHYGIDFLEVKDKSLREDLKYYVWKQSSMSVSTVAHGSYILIEFLNFITSYKKANKIDEFVNADLLEQWSFYIGGKEPSTNNNFVKRCRTYLKFYADKYHIPSLLIDILQQRSLDNDGGKPMTKHDIDLFSKKFQEQRKQGTIGEISYIIFNLAATTKLRSGEILALERNCILEKSERTGVIKYYSKTSGGQKMMTTLTIEKINLIEKAIRITNDAHSKAIGDVAKYIFIKEDGWRKDRIIEIVYQFHYIFSKIQKELEGQLDNKYRPYDLRSTFIDNIYTEGIKDGLPTKVIAEMVGNGERTAIKYYRNITEAQEYAEIFAGITVSGVDVYGNILDEKEVEDLNPVEDGLGVCKQDSCVNDEDEYPCLICLNFATTINRKLIFKQRITTLKTRKESTLNDQERRELDIQLKLYTAYYIKILNKIGDEEDTTTII